jgi:uncharacterized protein (DUF58 family)
MAAKGAQAGDRRGEQQQRAPGRTHAGRAPSLTRRGQAWAAGAVLLIAVGGVAGAWRVVALGVVQLAALFAFYVAFFPTSVLIWRRHLELLWRVERGDGAGFVAGRPFRLTVTLRNRAPRPLGRARLRPFTSAALTPPAALTMQLGAAREATVTTEVHAQRVGFWFLHGAAVEVQDVLGLCTVEAYFPSPLAVKILPRASLRLLPPAERPQAGAPHDRLGLHALRHRGLGGDLRELREHAPGDPFKQIAWKATARTGKLMVRELDTETLVTHWLLVDVAGTMREGRPGLARLDLAIDVAAAYTRGALEAGDRVGLITFDGRIVGEARPNDGPVHRLHILERLMEAMSVVDEDLTELTDSELVHTVARYLLLQEGLDARLRKAPPIDDPAWAELAASPAGELYDLKVVLQAVSAALGRAKLPVTGPEMVRLRAYCKLRGIELPYRRTPEAGRRARGLAAALERVAAERGSQRVLVLSDLAGLDELGPVTRALRLVRRRGHHLTLALPQPRLAPVPDDAPAAVEAALTAEIFGWHERRRERAAERRLLGLGVRVIPISAENAAALLTRPAPGGRARVA